MRQRPDMDFIHDENEPARFKPDRLSQVCALCFVALIVLAVPIAIDVLGQFLMGGSR